MAKSDNIENVIELFYSGANYTPEIQKYLNDFQSSAQSLNYIWPLLDNNKCVVIRYFAASSLYKIVKRHWDDTCCNILLNVISFLSHDYNNDITNERMMMVLAHLILRKISVDSDLIKKLTFSSNDKYHSTNEMGLDRKTTACVLKYIPEEFGSVSFDRVERNIARSHLRNNVEYVLNFANDLLPSYQNSQPPNAIESDLICRSLAFLNAWVSIEEVSLDFAQNLPTMEALVGKVFPMLNVPTLNGAAIGFINSLINFPELYKYPNFVKLLIGGMMSLEPLLADVNYVRSEARTELRSLICTLIEVHCGLLISLLITHYPIDPASSAASTTPIFDTIRRLLSWLLSCTETPGVYPLDEQITPVALGVYVAFTDEINDILPRQIESSDVTNEETRIRQDLYATLWEPLYTRVVVAMLKKLRLPDTFSRWDSESCETFLTFRTSELCRDVLSAIRNVLKIAKVLHILHDHLLRSIEMPVLSANLLLEFEIVLHLLNNLGDNLFQWQPPTLSGEPSSSVQTKLVKVIHRGGLIVKFDCLAQNSGSEKIMVLARRTVLKYIARFAPFLRSAEDPNHLPELLKWVSASIYAQNTMVPAFEALNAIFESYASEIDQATSQQIYQLCQTFHHSYYQWNPETDEECMEKIVTQYTCPVLAKIFLEICSDSGPEQLVTILQSLFAQTIDELSQNPKFEATTLKDEILRRLKMLTVLDAFLLAIAQRMPLCETEQSSVQTHYLHGHPSHKQVLLSFVSQISPSLLKNIEVLTRPPSDDSNHAMLTSHNEIITNLVEKSLNILADSLQLFPLSPTTFTHDIALFNTFVPTICCHLVESIYVKNPLALARANIFGLAKDYVVTFCKQPQHACDLSQICQKYMARGIIDVTLSDQAMKSLLIPTQMSGSLPVVVPFFRFIMALLQKVPHVLLPQSCESADIQRIQRIFSIALETLKASQPEAALSGLNLTSKLLLKRPDLDPHYFDFIVSPPNSTHGPLGPALTAALFYVLFPEKLGCRDNRLYVETTLRPCCELILALNKCWTAEFKAWLEAYMPGFETRHRSQLTHTMLGERSWRRMVDQITHFKMGTLRYSEF